MYEKENFIFSGINKKPSHMKKVTNFRDLEVYKLCRQLAKEIFELSKKFPKEETYSLTDQMRRASRSVGGQIAEALLRETASAGRRGENEDMKKLRQAGTSGRLAFDAPFCAG